ncbi:unnamed protein product [Urochloa humidicola]
MVPAEEKKQTNVDVAASSTINKDWRRTLLPTMEYFPMESPNGFTTNKAHVQDTQSAVDMIGEDNLDTIVDNLNTVTF